MGCVASKLEVEEEVVTILRERKNHLKVAVERRYTLAEAHTKYNKSLFAVSAAINLFVARHSSPNPTFLITYCDSEVGKASQPQNPLLEHSRTNHVECQSVSDSSGSEEHEELHHQMHQHQQEKHVNNYYFMQMPPPIPIQSGNEDSKTVREQEGIPELEEEDTLVNSSNAQNEGVNVTDAPEMGRELLEALGDIEDYFLRAYYSGKEVSRMLGSHSLTLERLYAWEKKLYAEVKAGDNTRKIYEKKCLMLKHHETKGDNVLETDKTRTEVKDLHARILVAIRSAESISRRIDKLRDEELQPQIHELLQGLMRSWKVLMVAHETQNRIISEVKSFTCPTYEKFCTDSQRLATLQLQIELHSWRTCFMNYIAATKGYVRALYNWLSKFVATEVEVNTVKQRSSSIPVVLANGPPLLMTCHNWLESMKLLPDQSVSFAMKGFARDVRVLWVRQGEELQQKRKVETLAKEYEKRLKQVQNPILAIKLTDEQCEPDDDSADKKNLLDALQKRLDLEKEKHQNCMQQTQYITLNGLQTGFCRVFVSLIKFSQASLEMYSNLLGIEESSKT